MNNSTRFLTSRSIVIAAASGLSAGFASAQSFVGLGVLPGGISSYAAGVRRDGSVVGSSYGSNVSTAFRWTRRDGMISLGTLEGQSDSYAAAITDDGSLIVGWSGFNPGAVAFRWTAAAGLEPFGALPGASDCYAYAATANGSAILGYCFVDYDMLGWRWSTESGMVQMSMPSGYTVSWPSAMSADGSLIVGGGQMFPDTMSALAWGPDGSARILPLLPGDFYANASAVTRDGRFIVGSGSTQSGPTALRWGLSGPCQHLGTLPGTNWQAYPLAISDDGSIIVGYFEDQQSSIYRPLWWTQQSGMMDLNTYFPSVGIDLTGWTLFEATGISGDGLTVVGYGDHNGHTEAWIATLPPPCYPNCDASTVAPILNVNDFVCFLNKFAAGDPYANCDHSTTPPVLNVLDFTCFLNQFAAGCT